jgi:hypothetical protein
MPGATGFKLQLNDEKDDKILSLVAIQESNDKRKEREQSGK